MDTTCKLCGSTHTEPFLVRENVLVNQNFICESGEEAKRMPRGDLNLYTCHDCCFTFNASFDIDRVSYNEQYNNNQTHSPMFREYTDALAERVLSNLTGTDGYIVEVGCGKADFLRRVFDLAPTVKGYGFDPSYQGEDTDFDGRLHFVKDFYSRKYEEIKAGTVICRHVIEHVEKPMEVLSTVHTALRHSPQAKVYFETPCLNWILENGVVWDFFYEHCSYFNADSLRYAFEKAGFTNVKTRHVFNGQYLWLEAEVGPEPEQEPRTPSFEQLQPLIDNYLKQEQTTFEHWNREIALRESTGGIAIWGAGAKGVTFANLVDPQASRIACIVDVNPKKQGKYLPGTGHPIVSSGSLQGGTVRTIIPMNPNYIPEIQEIMNRDGINAELLEF